MPTHSLWQVDDVAFPGPAKQQVASMARNVNPMQQFVCKCFPIIKTQQGAKYSRR